MTRRLEAIVVLSAVLAMSFAGRTSSSQSIVGDISEHNIELQHSFEGLSLLVFGAVDHRNEAAPLGAHDIIVVLRGPEENIVVRRKERTNGIWVNRSAEHFDGVPGYFAVAATAPITEIASPDARMEWGLELVEETADERRAEFVEGLKRAKAVAGLFTPEPEQLYIQSETLFQARFSLPSHTPVGPYGLSVILLDDGEVIATYERSIEVQQAGLVLTVSTLARQHSTIYGILAVLVALFAGWVAGFVGRR